VRFEDADESMRGGFQISRPKPVAESIHQKFPNIQRRDPKETINTQSPKGKIQEKGKKEI